MRERLRRLERAARRQRGGGDDGPPRFWLLTGDGFARCGDQVLTEDEHLQRYGPVRTFTLRLGDRSFEPSAESDKEEPSTCRT